MFHLFGSNLNYYGWLFTTMITLLNYDFANIEGQFLQDTSDSDYNSPTPRGELSFHFQLRLKFSLGRGGGG